MTIQDPEPVPGVDLTYPNPSRIYDYWLGGDASWAIDREFAHRVEKYFPIVRDLARTNREFVQRSVAFLVRQGVTQFLDLGSGIPTVRNVHEVAQEVGGDATRVVYVDFEPVAIAHSRYLLEKNGDPDRHAILHENLLNAETVWQQACETGVLDPTRPVGLVMGAVLHFLPGQQTHEGLAVYRDLLPPGSALALTHVTDAGVPDDLVDQLRQFTGQYEKDGAPAVCLRDPEEIGSFFGDLELEPPGLVWLPEWHLDAYPSPTSRSMRADPARSCVLGAMGWKGPRGSGGAGGHVGALLAAGPHAAREPAVARERRADRGGAPRSRIPGARPIPWPEERGQNRLMTAGTVKDHARCWT